MIDRCEEIDDLVALYAADALDEDERVSLLEHLAECRRHDDDIAAARRVAGALALALPPVPPPAALRGRLLDAFDAAVADREASPPGVADEGAAPLRFLRRPAFAYAVATALLAVAVGLGACNLSLQDDADSRVVTRSAMRDGLQLRVVYLPGERLAVLEVDLPPAPPGRAYQAWQITPAGPRSLGLIASRGRAAFEADLSAATAIAISIEPAGGSPAPTTEPVLVSRL